MLRVGLTGGIGSGKSEVSKRLAERGAIVIDADQLAREVVEPGTAGLTAIVEAFGPDVLTEGGQLDRAALGARAFAGPEQRRRLEQIIHPRVRTRAAQIEAAVAGDVVVVHDIPLLVETGQSRAFDLLVVVDVPEEVQLKRLIGGRGMTESEARARIAAQAGRLDRTSVADHVIDNTGTLAELGRAVDRLWEQLIR